MEQSSVQRTRRATAGQAARQVSLNAPDLFDDEYESVWPTRMPSSARRYQSDVKMEVGHAPADVQTLSQSGYYGPQLGRRNTIPPRRTATRVTGAGGSLNRRQTGGEVSHVDTDEIISRKSEDLEDRWGGREKRAHWLVYVGMALVIMLLGWVVLSGVARWWQVTQDDWHYGRPRTYQVDAVVGHNDSAAHASHFVALNLNRHVEVIEFPGGDSSKVKIYVGPVLLGQDQDLAPVTLSFKDVNGDGKPDMIINVQDSHFVFINDNGAFRSQNPGENVQS